MYILHRATITRRPASADRTARAANLRRNYNSTGSEQIWMKFGELREYCLELVLTGFGRDPRRSESGRTFGNFVLSRAVDIIHSFIISTALDATEGIFAVLYVSIMGLSLHVFIKRQFFFTFIDGGTRKLL